MKINLLFILLTILLTSCGDKYIATPGYMFKVILPDSTSIITNEFTVTNTKTETRIIIPEKIYSTALGTEFKIETLPYVPDYEYSEGYKRGQIDILEGRGCYAKVMTDDGEVLWKDTCKVKRKPKL